MLIGSYQVADVLMLVGCVAPIAVYFLTLGLVNSHGRPFLVSARSDFLSLSIALAPLFIWTLPVLAQTRAWWLLAAGGAVAALGFAWMLPRAQDGFVVYNIAEPRCRRLLADALEAMGWHGRWLGSEWFSQDGATTIRLIGIGVLRNVSIHVRSDAPRADKLPRLERELSSRLREVTQLPSSTGVCLVLIGAALLIAPVSMLSRHIDDLVEVMSHILG